ncbi:MAG: arginine--tRNA ligase [Candidatus Methanosuratincola sp.]
MEREVTCVMSGPFAKFMDECTGLVKAALEREGIQGEDVRLVVPGDPSLGELSFSTFALAKKLRADPKTIASKIATSAREGSKRLIGRIEAAGAGYVNFYVEPGTFAEELIRAVGAEGAGFGSSEGDGERVIVEHTSVNPIHPIHIGGARNAVIGDCISRILKAAGKDVRRHFYIDDVGLQVSQAAYGLSMLGGEAAVKGTLKVNGKGKGDHFIGFVYASTSCAMNIRALKGEIERLKAEGKDEEARGKIAELDDWVAVSAELREKDADTFDRILDGVNSSEDPEGEVADLLKRYESKDPAAVSLIRGLCEAALEGFRETLGRVGIGFDSWDWESETASWNGGAKGVVERLSGTGFTRLEDGTVVLDCEAVVERFGLREKYGIRTEVPPLTLMRSDGTTLYTTRDIAYTLWKFGRAERVINVISIEQKLPQLQLKIALHALGMGSDAERLMHYSYELVHLPGYKMSGRRGRYVTFDEVLDEAVQRAYREVTARSPHLSEEERRRISEVVGIGAVRYALAAVAPQKPITFTWDRVINFEQNSAPFIQYAHARACNILVKAGHGWKEGIADYSALASKYERELVVLLSKFPEVVGDAARNLRPEEVAEYANELASKFNLFYDNMPVLKAEGEGVRNARLHLVDSTRIVLSNALALLGVKAPERM